MNDMVKRFRELSGLVESRPQYMAESTEDCLFREMEEQAYGEDVTLEALTAFSHRLAEWAESRGLGVRLTESQSGKKLHTVVVQMHHKEPVIIDQGQGQTSIEVHKKNQGIPLVRAQPRHSPKPTGNTPESHTPWQKHINAKKKNPEAEATFTKKQAEREIADHLAKTKHSRLRMRTLRQGGDYGPPEGYEGGHPAVRVYPKPLNPAEVGTKHDKDTLFSRAGGKDKDGQDVRHELISKEAASISAMHRHHASFLDDLVKHPPKGHTPEDLKKWARHASLSRRAAQQAITRVQVQKHKISHQKDGQEHITSHHPYVGHNPAGDTAPEFVPAKDRVARLKAAAAKTDAVPRSNAKYDPKAKHNTAGDQHRANTLNKLKDLEAGKIPDTRSVWHPKKGKAEKKPESEAKPESEE